MEDYRKSIEKDPALERRFQPVKVREATVEESAPDSAWAARALRKFHHVRITDEAIVAAAQLPSATSPDRFLPDKAIDLIDEAAARLRVSALRVPPRCARCASASRLQDEKDAAISVAASCAPRPCATASSPAQGDYGARGRWSRQRIEQMPLLGEHEIAEVVVLWTGIPALSVTLEESQRLLELEDELHQRVIGQDEAVKAVARPCAARAPNSATRAGPSARSSSSGPPASARRNWPVRWPPRSSAARTR